LIQIKRFEQNIEGHIITKDGCEKGYSKPFKRNLALSLLLL